jgi:hypothetical protein
MIFIVGSAQLQTRFLLSENDRKDYLFVRGGVLRFDEMMQI